MIPTTIVDQVARAPTIGKPKSPKDTAPAELVCTPAGVVLDCNHAAARMFRVPLDADLRGRNCVQEPLVSRFVEMIGALELTGRLENMDGVFTRWDGSPLHLVVNLEGRFDEARTLASIRARLFDIAEWRRANERPLLERRVEALGLRARAIAHDFNNVLMVISGHAERLALALPPDSPLLGSVDAIQESFTRAAALSRQLSALGRHQVVLQPKAVNLNAPLGAIVGDLRRVFGRRIAVDFEASATLPDVQVDAEQVEQALATLAGHGIDAMPDGGSLRVTTHTMTVGIDCPGPRSFVEAGSYVQVEMTYTALARAVEQGTGAEPFVVADRSEDGPGLEAVFGLVQESGGYLWAAAAPGGGTTYTLLFPCQLS